MKGENPDVLPPKKSLLPSLWHCLIILECGYDDGDEVNFQESWGVKSLAGEEVACHGDVVSGCVGATSSSCNGVPMDE